MPPPLPLPRCPRHSLALHRSDPTTWQLALTPPTQLSQHVATFVVVDPGAEVVTILDPFPRQFVWTVDVQPPVLVIASAPPVNGTVPVDLYTFLFFTRCSVRGGGGCA